MRKYLWALAFCTAAGMAVLGVAQDRSKFFGLGRTKTETPPAKGQPAKLKNYSELFEPEGRAVVPSQKESTDAPSPDNVKRMLIEAEQARQKQAESDRARSGGDLGSLPPIKPPPASNKSSLLDEFDELEQLDAAEERQEEQEASATPTPKRTADAGRVIPRKPAPGQPRASDPSEKRPSWADSTPGDEEPVVDFKQPAIKQPAKGRDLPKIDLSAPDEPVEEAPVTRSLPTKARVPAVNPNVVASRRPEPPTKPTVRPTVRPPLTPVSKSRLDTPIPVDVKGGPGTGIDPELEEEIARLEEQSERLFNPREPDPEVVVAPAPPTGPSNRLNFTPSTRRPSTTNSLSGTDNSSRLNTPLPAKTSTTAMASPSVSVEWRSTGSVNVGQESSCEMIVKNSGAVSAQRVEVEATFPKNVRLVSANPRPASTTELIWALGEIAAGEEKIVQVTFIPIERGAVAAAASVRFTGAASTSIAVTEPLLSAVLEGPKDVMVGENASHTLLVSNPGSGTATNVKVEAIIPAGLENARGDHLTMDLGSLAPGENRPIRLALTAIGGGRQPIEAHVTADAGLDESASAVVTVIAPSLAASIKGPGLRYLGRNAIYTLHVANDGAAGTDNVRVMHKIPDGFDFVSAEKGAQFDPQNRMLNWFVGRLDRGASSQVAVVLKAKSTGEYTHFIRATSEHGAISDADIKTRVEGAASLVVNLSDIDDPVEVGVETAYEIRIKNEGTAPAKNVGLTCELPVGMEFLAASGESSYATKKDLVAFEPIPELAVGKTLTYRVKVKGTLTGNMRFRTKVSSDSLSEPLASEELTKIYGE